MSVSTPRVRETENLQITETGRYKNFQRLQRIVCYESCPRHRCLSPASNFSISAVQYCRIAPSVCLRMFFRISI